MLNLLLGLGLLLSITSLSAQISETQTRELLAQRGIPEDTLRARLLKKGYNPDTVRPDQIPAFQNVLSETIQEIEADLRRPATPEPIATKPEVVKEDARPTPTTPTVTSESGSPNTPKKDPIYGQEIFRDNSIAVYQRSDEMAPTESYVLGIGDKLGIIGFGRSQFEQILEIGPEGFVQPGDRIPKILLKGIRFGDAKELLFQRYSQAYVITRSEFQVTLNKPRNITVSVFGEARVTGAFTLPGINTAFNVISAAGGPTDIGSVRRIKVIRGEQVIPLDVYAFMNDPGVARNFFLQSNDIIHIPVARKVVRINGAVTRPMLYELLEQENLARLIDYAGGAAANAYLSDVRVTRFLDDRRVVTNVNLRDLMTSGGDYILYHGDVVEIKRIEDRTDNVVTISGAVTFPGVYERREDMRVVDLLRQGVLRNDARLDFAYLLRYQPDGTFRYERLDIGDILKRPESNANAVLADQDVIQIMTLKTYAPTAYFTVEGAVKIPDTFAIDPQGVLTLEDAILMAGGPLPEASEFGYIIRQDPTEPKRLSYIHFNLVEVLEAPGSKANMQVRSGDMIRVFDKGGRRDDLTVNIYGAVRNPGNYPYGPGMRLADLVNIAGGFIFEADPGRIDIARSEVSKGRDHKVTQYSAQLPRDFETALREDNSIELQPFDHIYVRSIPEYERKQTVQLQGEVMYPGTYPLVLSKERISSVIGRAGGLTPEAFPEGAKLYRQGDSTGLVVIDLHEALRNNSVSSNIVLIHGDVIQIPKSRELVTITGHVNLDEAYSAGFLRGEKSISVAFRGIKNARYYIDNFAAGVSDEGAPGQIKVQFADGRVEKTKKFLFFNQYPKVEKGSIVTVGPKRIKPTVERPEKKADWSNVLRDTMAQATAVLTLLILVDQLSK